MLDRSARTKVRWAVDDYLCDRISAFEFNNRIGSIAEATDDDTVKIVIDQLWHLYDDCDDHLVVADRAAWDTFNDSC